MMKACLQLTVLVLLLVSWNTLSAAAPEVTSGRLLMVSDFESEFVPNRNIYVWLPEGYSENRRYAVLYMHDGDSLWDAAASWNGQEWGVDEAVSGLLDQGAIRDVIVVGIPNAGSERGIEYLPQKPFETMTRSMELAPLEPLPEPLELLPPQLVRARAARPRMPTVFRS